MSIQNDPWDNEWDAQSHTSDEYRREIAELRRRCRLYWKEVEELRDCGWERVTDAEALRRDAERYRWLLNWLVRTGLLTAQRCRIDAPETYGDWYILKKPYVVDGTALVGYGKTEDAAIDAAMKEDKT
jgi:hypothetical protein